MWQLHNLEQEWVYALHMQEVKIQDLNKLISTDLAEVRGFDAIEHNTLVQHGFCSGQLVPVPDSEAEKSQLCNLL